MKILNRIQWEIIQIALDPNVSDQEVSDLFVEEMQALFSPEQPSNAWDMYGRSSEKRLTTEIMAQELNDCMTMLENVQTKVQILKERINATTVKKEIEEQLSKELLPKEALASAYATRDQQVMVQQKQKTKQSSRCSNKRRS